MRHRLAPVTAGLALASLPVACGPADDAGPDAGSEASPGADGVVEVAARDFEFDAPETLRPGLERLRLEGGAAVDEIVAWMDWMDLEEFRAPAPASRWAAWTTWPPAGPAT